MGGGGGHRWSVAEGEERPGLWLQLDHLLLRSSHGHQHGAVHRLHQLHHLLGRRLALHHHRGGEHNLLRRPRGALAPHPTLASKNPGGRAVGKGRQGGVLPTLPST